MDELQHYGILGMRWGIRRTPAQLGHPEKSQKQKKSKKSANTKDDGASSGSKKSAKEMSDDELKQAISRLELEKKYKDLSKSSEQVKTNNGKAFVQGVLRKSGDNIATQLTTYVMGTAVNRLAGSDIVNPKKGQKDK